MDPILLDAEPYCFVVGARGRNGVTWLMCPETLLTVRSSLISKVGSEDCAQRHLSYPPVSIDIPQETRRAITFNHRVSRLTSWRVHTRTGSSWP